MSLIETFFNDSNNQENFLKYFRDNDETDYKKVIILVQRLNNSENGSREESLENLQPYFRKYNSAMAQKQSQPQRCTTI